nr:immunoglobulin heavy chain junction region [Mus musculus]
CARRTAYWYFDVW